MNDSAQQDSELNNKEENIHEIVAGNPGDS